ncbi:hypothetical protein BU17DRAFT_71809 [Hysterangium stoloniferum]|nr:hypothetical protein BU17DRAFT_71809 [Hysterangium stoloniferum]
MLEYGVGIQFCHQFMTRRTSYGFGKLVHIWKTVDGRWKMAGHHVISQFVIRLYEGNFWRSSKDCSSNGYEPSPLIHNCIFKGRLFKKQLDSNYLPLAVSSHTSLTTGIAVLFSYDTILTLPAEIQFVWKSRIRLPSVLYIIARYFVLIECICYVVFDWADGPLEHILAQITQPRMYVRDITGKGLRYKQRSEIPFNTDIVNISRRILLPCDSAEGALTITFDGLILFITLFYTIGTIRLQRGIKELRKRSITYLIVQQGVLRFVVIFIWNLQNIIMNKTPFSGIVQTWNVGNISVLLVCRFFLDVREFNSSCRAINPTNSFVVTTFRAAEILFRVQLTKGNSPFIPQRGVRKPMVVRELKAMVHGDAISTKYYE